MSLTKITDNQIRMLQGGRTQAEKNFDVVSVKDFGVKVSNL